MADHQAQLDWERRAGRPAAAAAFASAVFLVANTILVQAVVLQGRPSSDRGILLAIDEQSAAFLASGFVQALNYLGLGVVLWYLFRATRYRRPELGSWFVWLIYLGPLLFALAGVMSAFERIDIADQFASSGVTEGRAGERRAENLLEDRAPVPIALGAAGTLALAFSLVLVSLNAMRAGLLSRFLGIIGVIVGALYVLPIFGGPLIVQLFWLGALGAVFLGVWPGGRGESWDTGEAGTWVTAAEERRRAMREMRKGPTDPVEPEPQPPDPDRPEPSDHPVSKKRRKKRRR